MIENSFKDDFEKLTSHVNKTMLLFKNDETFESVKHLIEVPIVYIGFDKARGYIKKIQSYKTLYKNHKNT